jgi:hypothetical protein
MLDGDRARINALREDPFVKPLVEEIRTMWQYITPTMSRRRNSETGRLIPISSRDKWHRYFHLEYQVLTSISRYLIQTHNEFFTEHDGWCCAREVDENSLRIHVKKQTGFDIKIQREILE